MIKSPRHCLLMARYSISHLVRQMASMVVFTAWFICLEIVDQRVYKLKVRQKNAICALRTER